MANDTAEDGTSTTGTDRRIGRRRLLRSIGAAGVSLGGVGAVAEPGRGYEASTAASTTAFAKRATALQDLANTITIRAKSDAVVYYQFTVTGSVEAGSNTDSEDSVSGNTVSGAVGDGRDDTYRFSGRITSFSAQGGPVEILLNGEPIDDLTDLLRAGGDSSDSASGAATNCLPIDPLRTQTPVEEFYGYVPDADEPNSQRSNTGLEAKATSRLLFYDGPEGLSLVMFHGGGEGDQGGAATFEVTGLPADGEWVVLDDGYEGSRDEFEISDTSATLNWAWGVEGRSDGAVFRGLGDEFEIRIDPAFNEAAELEPFGPGEIERWQILSATADGFTAYQLPLDQPIVLSDSC